MQPRVGRRNFFVLIYERVNARGTREDRRSEMRRYSFAKHSNRNGHVGINESHRDLRVDGDLRLIQG
jgi:hypothetical protein